MTRQLAEKTATFRHSRTTILEPINRAKHQIVGGVERAHQSTQAATRAVRTDIRVRNRCGHCAWTRTFPVDDEAGQRGPAIDSSLKVIEAEPLGKSGTGTCYKSALLPFMEACMIRVPIEPPGLRRKLDVQWMKGT